MIRTKTFEPLKSKINKKSKEDFKNIYHISSTIKKIITVH